MKRIFLAGWICLAAGSSVWAQPKPLTMEAMKSAEQVDAVTIPTAGEFFSAMDSVGRPAWSHFVRQGGPPPSDSRAVIALQLGTYVADGYVAVEAQDGQAVKNTGKEILALAKRLNVNQTVLGRANSLSDFAENNDWNALREELEATQNEVKLDMSEQKDDQLISLVSLGAWIRGVEIVSQIISKTYSPEGARLLRQPAIIEYLIDEIDDLPDSTKEEAILRKIRASLQEALGFVSDPTPSEEQVRLLHAIMKSLYEAIEGKPATQ
ncbi:MAG: hypothetical protein Fur0032_03500 [Terrimicrobiaceae bacterium]